jgi:dipeptidyl aminopeptidase/acylaminoacyl peptidase
MRRIATLVLSAVLSSLAGAQQRPSSEVFLAPFSMESGRPVVGKPVNVSAHPGYNNQPSFTPDSRSMLFTSDRDGGQTDIYRLDVSTRTITRLTKTPESEYSATVMPDGKRFSVIRVEADQTQRLWSFAMDGTDPKLVIQALKPVGYHAWIGAEEVVSFVLGNPNALVHTDIRTQKSDTLAQDIGRSLLPIPGKRAFSFVQRVDSSFIARRMDWPSKRWNDIVAMPKGAQDLVWADSVTLLAGAGTQLLTWREGAQQWKPVDVPGGGLKDITRLAISRDGKWIAIVAASTP